MNKNIQKKDELLNNSNFRNNQNYFISQKYKNKLLTKIEYVNEKGTYIYIRSLNGGILRKRLKVGNFGYIYKNVNYKNIFLTIKNILNKIIHLIYNSLKTTYLYLKEDFFSKLNLVIPFGLMFLIILGIFILVLPYLIIKIFEFVFSILIVFTILYIPIYLKGVYFKWRLKGKYLFLVDKNSKYKILVYRYK